MENRKGESIKERSFTDCIARLARNHPKAVVLEDRNVNYWPLPQE